VAEAHGGTLHLISAGEARRASWSALAVTF
jgi:hypothetical protein